MNLVIMNDSSDGLTGAPSLLYRLTASTIIRTIDIIASIPTTITATTVDSRAFAGASAPSNNRAGASIGFI